MCALDDLARMERGQRDLGGAGEPEVVVGELVGFLHVAGELALVEERLLAGDGGDGDRGEAGLGDLLERPAHQLGLEQGEAALEAVGAAARDLDDAAEVRPVVALDQRDMVERLEGEGGRRAFLADDGVEALVGPDRRAFPGDAGQLQHQSP